jgi:ribosomal protein L37AE/L43A
MGEIKLDGYLCERCTHKWVGRNGSKPIVCPKCKSPYWDRPVNNGTKKGDGMEFGLFPSSKK